MRERKPACRTAPPPCATCHVRHATLCADLPESKVRTGGLDATKITVRRGDTLFCEGERARYVYVVAAGVIMSYKVMRDGRRMISDFLYPGDILGEDCPEIHAFSAEAATDAGLCLYAHDMILARIASEPDLGRKILGRTSAHLSSVQNLMLVLAKMTARERLAHFLLRMSAATAGRGEPPERLWLPLSRTLIADHLGLTMETVSRTLTQFAREGLIAAQGSTVELRDMAALRALAGVEEQPVPAGLAAAE